MNLKEDFNLANKIFGYWVVIKKEENTNQRSRWLCRCACGVEKVLFADTLRRGLSKSCGCKKGYAISQSQITHGDIHSKEYHTWANMKSRCSNKNNNRYYCYGAKGIKVCKRWLHSYENFFLDMGRCPKGMSLDRVKTHLGYSKSNCRWATAEVQANNTTTNCFITYLGETLTIMQWSRKLNMDRNVFYKPKYRGMPKEKVVEIFYNKKMNGLYSII